jgi:hypothetical protein
MKIPHFIIKNNFQKGGQKYSNLLTKRILRDVCERITGLSKYTYDFDNTGYNKGRLAVLKYKKQINYISFSENKASGRNSSFQSFPTALIKYYEERNKKKKLFFYFLPTLGNYETPYFTFMYRLIKTAGAEFLNENDFLSKPVSPFLTIEDIITARDVNKGRNRSNNSTFLTRNSDNSIELYGKTYGANKKETTILCIALSKLTDSTINLHQISEKNLTILPKPDLEVIQKLGNIKTYVDNTTMERSEYEKDNSFRSATYIFNLFVKFGSKKCAFCTCDIPQLVQGAHIWPVAQIKKMQRLNQQKKLKLAIDGENGIWLCQNHHKMLDLNILKIDQSGKLKVRSNLKKESVNYVKSITPIVELSKEIITPKFSEFLEKRNESLFDPQYSLLV